MSLSRTFLVLSAVLALSACGSGEGSQPAGDQQATAAAPKIEAIDEPAALAVEMPPADAGSTSLYLCVDRSLDEGYTAPDDCKPTPDEADEFSRMEEKFERAVKPAEGTKPRAIARLGLIARGPTARARLVAWRNQADELCIETEVQDESGGSSDGPYGPCLPEGRCNKICLGLSGSGSGGASRYLLSGVVASEADSLRMTLDDGRVVDYALIGPIVPGFDEHRVFMLDLGRDLDERLELQRDGKTIAEEKRSPVEIRMMRCAEDFPPVLPTQDFQGRRTQLDKCLKNARSQ